LSFLDAAAILAAGFGAGIVNAIVGSGSLLTFRCWPSATRLL
jgi:hypothetical protein